MNDDGKSFSELKDEYDAGEADWADEDGAETDADAAADEDPFDDGGDSFEDDLGDEPDRSMTVPATMGPSMTASTRSTRGWTRSTMVPSTTVR